MNKILNQYINSDLTKMITLYLLQNKKK